MSLPQKFKRAVFKEQNGNLVVEEVDMLSPGKGEVLVKVEACGVCHSDSFPQMNAYGYGYPIVPGHEIIGNVVAVGDGVTRWKNGDRIGGAWHGGHDGTCGRCDRGLYQICENGLINGVTKDGGYAEYCLLRSEAGVRIPPHVDAAKYAPILCAGVTVFNSMRKMNVKPGSLVAVQGLGGLGHLALQYANKFGYRVVALSRDNKKEEFARKLGAHEYIASDKGDVAKQLQELGGADLIVCTAPSADAIAPLPAGLGPLGKLLIVAVAGKFEVDTVTLISKGASVHGWPSGHSIDSEDAIRFTELEGIDCMIEKFPLDKAQEAFDAMNKGSVRFRAVITT